MLLVGWGLLVATGPYCTKGSPGCSKSIPVDQGQGTADDPYRYEYPFHDVVRVSSFAPLYLKVSGMEPDTPLWFIVFKGIYTELGYQVRAADDLFINDPYVSCTAVDTDPITNLQCPFLSNGAGEIFIEILLPDLATPFEGNREMFIDVSSYPVGRDFKNYSKTIWTRDTPALAVVNDGWPSYYMVYTPQAYTFYDFTLSGLTETVEFSVAHDVYDGNPPVQCSAAGTGTITCQANSLDQQWAYLKITLLSGRQQYFNLDWAPAP